MILLIANKYRCTIKPHGFAVANNVIKISSEVKFDPHSLIMLLNSTFMDFFIMNYNLNLSELTLAFYDSITLFTPINNDFNQSNQLYCILSKILHFCFLESEQDYLYFKKIADYLIYSLYFRELIQSPNKLHMKLEEIIFDIDFTFYDQYWNNNVSESKINNNKIKIAKMKRLIEENSEIDTLITEILDLKWVKRIENGE